MNIHFNHTEPVNASAQTLFDVITDYTSYPSFNSALIKVEVVSKDEQGAEFLADRKTKIGKQVRALVPAIVGAVILFLAGVSRRRPRLAFAHRRRRDDHLAADDDGDAHHHPHHIHRPVDDGDDHDLADAHHAGHAAGRRGSPQRGQRRRGQPRCRRRWSRSGTRTASTRSSGRRPRRPSSRSRRPQVSPTTAWWARRRCRLSRPR